MSAARKIPESEAFFLYVAMGVARSYRAVAAHYGVTPRSILLMAKRCRWADRLLEVEAIVAKRTGAEAVEARLEARKRHLGAVRLLCDRAVEGIANNKCQSVGESRRALETAMRLEAGLLGEKPTKLPKSREHEVDPYTDGGAA